MTVSTSNNVVILNADGSTHSFSFTFKIFAASDLKVIVRSTAGVETEKTLNSHYIIPTTSVENDSGGNILFKYNTGTSSDAHYSATDYRPANNEKVILRRTPVQEQDLNLVNNDPFDAETIEQSLDKLTMQVQAVQEEVDRSFRLSRTNILDKDGAQINNAFFQFSDDVAARKGKFLQFNSTTGVIEPSATSDDVTTLAAVTTDIALLADIQDGTTATNTLTVVSGISSNVTTCASISSDITSVAGISSNVTTVAGKASLITSDFATDIGLIDSTFVTNMNLVTSDFISDVNLITSDFITDMGLIDSTFVTKMNLVTSDFVTDMAAVTSDFVSDMSLVTADFISDVNSVATSSIIEDFNILATSDIVTDMNLLATSSNVTAMGNLGTSTNVTNMANLNASGVVTNISTVAGSISNVNTVAAADSNISALNASGVIANIATVAAADSNISTVATNISGVNSFADRYRVASSAPSSSLNAGDLYFDTSTNKLNVYGSSWTSTGEAASRSVTTHTVTSAGTQTISVSYTVGLVAVYLNGLHLSGADYTASNGSSVVITGCSVDDVIDIVALSAFNAANYGTASAKNVGISSDNVPVFTSGVADNDFLKIDGSSVEGRSASEVLSDIGGQASLTFGIANTNAVKVDHASAADDDYAKFTASGVEGRSYAEVKTDLSLNNVENTAISTWAGSSNVTTVGTVTSGTISTGAVLADVTMTLGSDADGDVYYRASNKLARLAKGTAGKVLAMNSGATAPEWANGYVHPNHSGEVTSTADGATVIADDVVDEANLKVSNSPTNGYFLSAQSGNTGGLTWAEAGGGGGAFTLLETVTITSNTATAVLDISEYSSTYDNFMVTGHNIGSDTNDDTFKVMFNTDWQGGTNYTWQDLGYYALRKAKANATDIQETYSSTGIIFTDGGAGGNAYQTMSFVGYYYDMHSTTNTKHVRHHGSGYSGYSDNPTNIFDSAQVFHDSPYHAVHQIRYQFGSNNIARGVFKLYGIAKT